MRWLVFSLVTCLTTPALAQDRMSEMQCANSWGAVQALTQIPAQARVTLDAEGWCLIENAVFGEGTSTRWRMDALRWRASDVDRFIENGLPPRTLDVVGEGLGIAPDTGNAVLDYTMALQSVQGPFGFGLSMRWDGVQNAVLVDEAYLNFFTGNRIEATARIDNVDLTDMTAIQMSVGSMGLSDLQITADFDGWFETYVAQALGPVLLQNGDITPQAQVATLKEQAIDALAQMPDAILPVQSRDDLGAFITSLPHPRGRARLQLSADPGLGAARMAPLIALQNEPSMAQIIDLGLAGVSLLFTWDPSQDVQ